MIRIYLPLQSKYFSSLYTPIDSYLSFFSIYQDWMMFSLNPSRATYYLTGEVFFDDGTIVTYSFPGKGDSGLLDKYIFGERYRKIISEAIVHDNYSFMWKDVARFALRKIKINHYNKIPLKVRLYRHWSRVPALELKFIPHLSKNFEYKRYNFYTYEVL